MTHSKNSGKPAYEERLVLFVDFLGFRDIVQDTERDPAELSRILGALDQLRDIPTPKTSASETATHFSDSFVASYLINEESAVFHLLNGIALAIIELVALGYLVRGAIVVGKLFHTKDYIVGPALIRAYELESKEAIYPRVIVDPEVISLARRFYGNQNGPDLEEEYAQEFIVKDSDGKLYLQYVDWHHVVDVAGTPDENYPEYLRCLGVLIEKGLRNPDAAVKHKYLWLYDQYIASIQFFEGLDDGDRVENEENCDLIIGLGRFEKDASQARKVVAKWIAAEKRRKK